MSRGYNKSTIMGNLARDPEVRYTTSKQAVAKLNVAVNRTWKNKDGEVKEDCDFIPVVVWGSQAENAEKYLRKGSQVLVEGRIQVRNYDHADGHKVWITEIVASELIYLSKPKTATEEPAGFGFGEQPIEISIGADVDTGEDADIPFQ